VDDVRSPAQLADRFQNATHKEQAAFVVVGKHCAFVVFQNGLALEVRVVVNEVNLNACRRDGRHLDDQGVVGVVDVQVHPGETNDLVKLVATFVDFSETWHEHANLLSFLMRSLGQLPRNMAHCGFREVGGEVLRNVEDTRLTHSVMSFVKRIGKIGIFTPKSK